MEFIFNIPKIEFFFKPTFSVAGNHVFVVVVVDFPDVLPRKETSFLHREFQHYFLSLVLAWTQLSRQKEAHIRC